MSLILRDLAALYLDYPQLLEYLHFLLSWEGGGCWVYRPRSEYLVLREDLRERLWCALNILLLIVCEAEIHLFIVIFIVEGVLLSFIYE
jgi:hypothetical protein